MARSAAVYRCPGNHRHSPVLGVFEPDGTLRVLKDSLKLAIHSGTVLLGCRDCGREVILSLPMMAQSQAALLSQQYSRVG